GYCGGTDAYCGSGCQPLSGNYTIRGVTSDGTCGVQNNDAICGNGFGSCCSSSGYCGNTEDYCGAGCQTGDCETCSDGVCTTTVSIDPTIWSETLPSVTCSPPCVVVLPPWSVPETTITFPPLTTTIIESNSTTSTETVVFVTFAPITTSLIPVYNLNITDPAATSEKYTVTPSIFPVATISFPVPPGISTATTSVIVTSTPGSSTIWPPVSSVPTIVSVTEGTPANPTCTNEPCSKVCTSQCGSCDKSSCSPTCAGCEQEPLCVGCACPPGTSNGGGGGSGGGRQDSDPNDDCTELVTATSTETKTHCEITEACSATGRTVTTTISTTASCGTITVSLWDFEFATDDAADLSAAASSISSQQNSMDATRFGTVTSGPTPTCTYGADPDQGIAGYCVCDSSTYSTLTGSSPCAYTSLPGLTTTQAPTATQPYTYTDPYGDVVVCSSSSVSVIAAAAECTIEEDPDQGIGAFCLSEGLYTYPTLTGSKPCAITITSTTTITPTPAPPYTYTDPYSDVIVCSSSLVGDAGGIAYTICYGSATTIVTGDPPLATVPSGKHAFDLWRAFDWEADTEDAHPHFSLSGVFLAAGSDTSPCDDIDIYLAADSEGNGLNGIDIVMYFNSGICNYANGVTCTSDDGISNSNLPSWTCTDQSTGATIANCLLGDDEEVTSCSNGKDEVVLLRNDFSSKESVED
ncbi:hypothetical protein BX600DRAFT_439681, partial [Xylariales sp. PMI_506]